MFAFEFIYYFITVIAKFQIKLPNRMREREKEFHNTYLKPISNSTSSTRSNMLQQFLIKIATTSNVRMANPELHSIQVNKYVELIRGGTGQVSILLAWDTPQSRMLV